MKLDKNINLEDARDFNDPKKNLTLSIIDDDDNSRIELRYGKSTHANDVKGLLDALRMSAWKFGLTFSAQQSLENIKPRQSAATQQESKTMTMSSLTEGMYGTSRSSYLRLENAKMIVRHSRKIDDNMIGARGRCVEHIFIEECIGRETIIS